MSYRLCKLGGKVNDRNIERYVREICSLLGGERWYDSLGQYKRRNGKLSKRNCEHARGALIV